MEKSKIRRRRRGIALGGLFTGAVMLTAFGGCSPIETYRHWTGVSANDPNPATTPNTKNLAAGDQRSYPNLATVPSPPSQELTTAELDKLTQSLIADRANAKYTSEHLQAQFNETVPPPPPPPPAAPSAGGAEQVKPPPTIPAPNPASPSPAPPSAGPARVASAAPPGSAAATPSSPGGVATAAPGTAGAKGKSKQPPEPGPMESSLQSPQIAPLPSAEQIQTAPPPPPGVANSPTRVSGAATHLPAAPPAPPLPAAIGSAKFQPAPPPPTLAPAAPIRTATAESGKPAKPAPPAIAFTRVADIAFSGDATTLSDAAHAALEKVLPRYRQKPGQVRVVGYAGVGSGAAQQLDAYRTALDRAQAVADGLRKDGIPASKIDVQAAPADSDTGQGRAEILFEQ